jgi:hypothetical protein
MHFPQTSRFSVPPAHFQPWLKHALPLTALKNIFQNGQGGEV